MLAYVFWHWPQASITLADYEARQRAFHAALSAEPPAGFLGSTSHALRGAPWTAAGGAAYEDWYLVDGSGALDPLNAAAVSASRQGPHDQAAAAAAGGTAGLYSLRMGQRVTQPAFAAWFGKPGGMRYDELMALLEPAIEGGCTLWMRHMVLGPSPEFCIHAAEPVQLPAELEGPSFALRPVWPTYAVEQRR